MLKNYLKTAFKVFLRRKFFTFVSLFGICFTLTVLMVVTAFLDHLFGPLPPEVKTDRTLAVFMLHGEAHQGENFNMWTGGPSYTFLDRYVRTLPDVERVSIFTSFTTSVPAVSFNGSEKVTSHLKYTDAAFWEILEFDFLEGGPFSAQDDRDANLVAVINQSTEKRFFGDTPALGRSFELEGRWFRVVGVVADVSILRLTPFADIWLPLGTSKSKEYLHSRDFQGRFQGLILARKAEDIPLIKEEFKRRLTQVEFPDPGLTSRLSGGAETFFELVSRMLLSNGLEDSHPGILLGAISGFMVLFMFLPTLNLVNLNLSRMEERSSEIGVRKAFGASSWTLVGQFVVENVLLALVGGALGLVLASLVLPAINNSGLIPYADFRLNYRVFGYGLITAVFFGVFSGVYPAWRMSRLHPVEALKGKTS